MQNQVLLLERFAVETRVEVDDGVARVERIKTVRRHWLAFFALSDIESVRGKALRVEEDVGLLDREIPVAVMREHRVFLADIRIGLTC